ncbi:hypothetical protein SLS56_004597 [Neofusicoccum ribis]|uniref:Uncharacterized protein n=1 Tax=Neofusicoccum ribis TaxID=45134 RepID=A0ABR3SVZ5_9PEZI
MARYHLPLLLLDGWSRDDFRRQQNFRTLEIHERQIMDQRTIVDRLMNSLKEMAEPNSDSEDEDEEAGGFDSNGSDPVSEMEYREEHGAQDAQESLTNAGEPSSRARNGSSGSNASEQLLSVPGSRSLNQRGKRRTRDSSAGGNSERDGGKRRKGPPTPGDPEPAKPSPKFACPFFKNDPEKENRITSEERLEDHMRSEERCPKQQEKPKAENINIQQERKLRCKKNMKGMAEYEKWKQVYRIIFDLVEESDTPNPYLDQSSQSFQIFSRFEQFSRESLPRVLRTELEQTFQRDTQAIEAQLRGQLITIAQRCQETLFLMFRESEENLSNPITDANPPNRNLESNLPSGAFEPPNATRTQEGPAASVEHDLASLDIPGMWDFNSWFDPYGAGHSMH